MADHLYALPQESVDPGNGQLQWGPKYFPWKFHPGQVACHFNGVRYGTTRVMLLASIGADATDEAFLAAQSDVYVFPDALDTPVTDPAVDAFFEAIAIPTDWLTPSTTWREFLRSTLGLFRFMNTVRVLSGGTVFEGGADLEQNYHGLTAIERQWLDAAVAAQGWPPITGNPKLRTLVKQLGTQLEQSETRLGAFVI